MKTRLFFLVITFFTGVVITYAQTSKINSAKERYNARHGIRTKKHLVSHRATPISNGSPNQEDPGSEEMTHSNGQIILGGNTTVKAKKMKNKKIVNKSN